MSHRREDILPAADGDTIMLLDPLSPKALHLDLNLITPPPSDEISIPQRHQGSETPRSHRSSSLTREFTKCHIYSDDTPLLTPIEEGSFKEQGSRNDDYSTPRKELRRLHGHYAIEKRDLHYYEASRKRTGISVTFCGTVCQDEQKTSSPIKIEMVGGLSWTLKPPPRKLNTLTSGANGRKDILSGLYKQNLYLVIKKIVEYLNPLDLVSMKDVSLNWREFATKMASRELEIGKELALRSRENLPPREKLKDVAKSRNETTPTKTLTLIENRIPSPKRRIPQSPELSPVSKRFCYYLREGRDLQENERLERCPKCRYPARVVDALIALCSRCSYEFCSRCRCKPHPGHSCNLLLSPTTYPESQTGVKRFPIGSKQSKKSLSRLLKI